MSHVVGIDLVVKSLEAVKRTCKELGLTFKENQKTFAWWGSWANDYAAQDAAYRLGIKVEDYGKCEHAIGVPGTTWEVGLLTHPKGEGFILAFDFFGYRGQPILNALGGQDANLFKQTYAANATEIEMEALGYWCKRETLKDGTIEITVTGMEA